MTFRLRFPTLFDALPASSELFPALETPPPRGARRGRLAVLASAVGLTALAGCEPPSPRALLDTEPVRLAEPLAEPPAEPPTRPTSDAPPVPPVDQTVAPGSGAIRLPFALQGYGT